MVCSRKESRQNIYFLECNNDRNQFVVFPRDYGKLSLMGTEADDGANTATTQKIDISNTSWGRDMRDLYWSRVRPNSISWDWQGADQLVDLNYNKGRKIIVEAFVRPSWLLGYENDSKFLPEYLAYLGNMTQRYGNKLYAIEIWNEPWFNCNSTYNASEFKLPNLVNTSNGCFKDQDELFHSYVIILNESRKVIKAINPNVKVVGPAFSGGIETYKTPTEIIAKYNGSQLLDAFTYHDYMGMGASPDEYGKWKGNASSRIKRVDQEVPMYRTALGGYNGSIYIDEVGLAGNSSLEIPGMVPLDGSSTNFGYINTGVDWHMGMNRAMKKAIMYKAEGIVSLIPHVFVLGGSTTYNLELYGWGVNNRGPYPKTSAWLMTLYWLENVSFVNKTIFNEEKTFTYAYNRSGESIVFAWNTEGNKITPLLISNAYVTDIYGRNVSLVGLGSEPVIYHSKLLDANTLLNNVKNALMPIPQSPNGLVASVISNSQINLIWNDTSIIEQGFKIERSPDGNNWNQIAIVPGRTTIYVDSGLISGTYYYRIKAYNQNGEGVSNVVSATTGSQIVNSNGLVAHWKFEDSLNVIDSIGGNTNGNYIGNAVPISNCLIEKCLSLDGNGDYVNLPSTSSDLNLLNNWTISLWLNSKNVISDKSFISIRSNYTTSGLRFYAGQNALKLQGFAGGAWRSNSFASPEVFENRWYNVIVVYDNGTIKNYLNGEFKGSANWGSNFFMDSIFSSKIGTEGSYYFNGTIDDVRIYNRVLSGQEIRSIYQFKG